MKALVTASLIVAAALPAKANSDVADGFVVLDGGEGLRATISPTHGGELSGLEFRVDGEWRELLYRARDYSETDGWRGKASFLWPAVGMTLEPREGGRGFRVDGRFHPMPAHGFARERAWRLVEEGADETGPYAVLGLSSDAKTRNSYPFDFELSVEYRLVTEGLRIRYEVRADRGNGQAMPFAIGNHITFKAPLLGVGDAGSVRFSNDLPDLLVRGEDRTFSGEVVSSPYRGEHPLAALPRRQAVSLGGVQGTAELSILDPSGLVLVLRHAATAEPTSPAIRFNLWADTVEGFFSPEPWLGTQNALNNGAGLLRLAPGESWVWTIEITPRRFSPPTLQPRENAS